MAEEEKIKLVATASVYSPSSEPTMWESMPASFGTDVDKLKLPTEFPKIIEMCRFYYKRDPIGATVVNKMVEIGVTTLHNKKGDCTDQEFEIFDSLKEGLLEFLRCCSLEYLLSGLVIVEKDWEPITLKELGLEGTETVEIPNNFWFRNPAYIEIKPTPIPNREIYLVKVSPEEIEFILGKGKYPDGTEDKETWKILQDQYPDFVKAITDDKKTAFKLTDPLVVRRKVTSESVYPTPFLYPALESMVHKRNLRKMDYSVASRVISAIQLISVGSDEFPVTADDEDVIDNLKSTMNWRQQSGQTDRVFQLFANHTVAISWVYPDVAALLSESKYNNVNQDILFALGFPRVLIVGEAGRSGTSTTEYALLGPTETLNDIRSQLLGVVKHIYKEILERNPNLKNAPEPAFTPVRLYDRSKIGTIAKDAFERGVISKTTYAMMIDEDYQKEMEYMVEEIQQGKDLGLPEFPEVPYSPKPSGGEEVPEGETPEGETEKKPKGKPKEKPKGGGK